MDENANGLLPIRQWAITHVTHVKPVGNIPHMTYETWQKRLDDAMRDKGFTMKSLSLSAGLGETFVRDALKRNRRPSIQNFRKLAKALEVSTAYLGGEDSPELTYVPLDEHDPNWRAEPDLPAAKAYSREAFTPSIAGALPEIDVRVGAGEGSVGEVLAIALGGEAISGHQIVNEWVFPEPFLRTEINATPNHTLVMAIVGDSMTPTYQPGDRVLVDLSQNELVSDTVYVISDGHSPPQIKRLQRVMFSDPVRVRIISDNPALETDTVELSRVRIIGRVVGHVARK